MNSKGLATIAKFMVVGSGVFLLAVFAWGLSKTGMMDTSTLIVGGLGFAITAFGLTIRTS